MEPEKELQSDEHLEDGVTPDTEGWRTQRGHQDEGANDEVMDAVLQRGGEKEEEQEIQYGGKEIINLQGMLKFRTSILR